MILKVFKNSTLQEANPDADWDSLFMAFKEISDFEGKVICLYYDYESPFKGLHDETKRIRISDYLEVESSAVNNVILKKDSGANLKKAALTIYNLQQDIAREIKDTVEEQHFKLAKEMRELNIKIGQTASEDKSFDHFMAYGKASPEIVDNILKLKDKCQPDYIKEILESATEEKSVEKGGDILTKKFKDRKG